MKYDLREDREIRRRVQKTQPYESRHSIKQRFKVHNLVNKFSRGLGAYGDAAATQSYVPKFSATTNSDAQLLDKYYSSALYPSMDTLTELGDTANSKKTWAPLILLAIALFFLFKS